MKGGMVSSETRLWIGLIHLQGQEVEKNYIKALYYIQKAADKGSAQAFDCLGLMNAAGYGCEINLPKAIILLKQAVEKGFISPTTCMLLGRYHLSGIGGIEKNVSLAKEYFIRAALRGSQEAFKSLEQIQQSRQ